MRTLIVAHLTGAALGLGLLCADAPAADVPALPGPGQPGGPVRPLAGEELGQFLRGREVFDLDFHLVNGLGTPDFNATSCRACHQDPVLGGSGALELNVSRFGRDHGGQGPYEDLDGGQILSKLRPPWEVGRENYDPAIADVFEQRQSPTLLGLGLTESISDEEILSNADPDDRDGNGIRGIARLVDVGGTLEVGRFGWKAQIPLIEDFIRDGMRNEIGITTGDDGRGFALPTDTDATPDPELTQDQIDDLEFFLANLGPPPRKGSTDPLVAEGRALFESVGCIHCHRVMQGAEGPVELFSDLLLHDVSASDYRGMAEPGAPVGFYRTSPLWGISDTEPYMHDGVAETLLDAIREHQGEAQRVIEAFDALTDDEEQALMLFLADL